MDSQRGILHGYQSPAQVSLGFKIVVVKIEIRDYVHEANVVSIF